MAELRKSLSSMLGVAVTGKISVKPGSIVVCVEIPEKVDAHSEVVP